MEEPPTSPSEHCTSTFLHKNSKQFVEVATQTDSYLTISEDSPQEQNLKKHVRGLKRNLSIVVNSQSQISEADFVAFCRSKFSDKFTNFLISQLELTKSKGQRYSKEFKQFALTIYFMGPNVYNFLKTIFLLPSNATLARITEKWPIEAGLNNYIFSAIKSKVFLLKDLSKECILCLDGMSLKQCLYYQRNKDNIIGFHKTYITNKYETAKNVLVFMVRGIHTNWKQPVVYFFINNNYPGTELKSIVYQWIENI